MAEIAYKVTITRSYHDTSITHSQLGHITNGEFHYDIEWDNGSGKIDTEQIIYPRFPEDHNPRQQLDELQSFLSRWNCEVLSDEKRVYTNPAWQTDGE